MAGFIKGLRSLFTGRAANPRPVLICTEYQAVFYGYVEGDTLGKDPIPLKKARMIVRWGTTRGLMQLGRTGPTENSVLTLPADMDMRKVTTVIEISSEAAKVWKKFEEDDEAALVAAQTA